MINLDKLSDLLIGLGFLLLILAISLHLQKINIRDENSNFLQKTSLTERDAAILNALKNNRKDYHFTTSFIPGIGIINDPQSYLKQWEDSAASQDNQRSQGDSNP